jgi:hypothetical protein
MTLPDFEAWMAKMLHYVHYSDGWFWHAYKEEFGTWPTPEMKRRGLEMRAVNSFPQK